MAELLTQLLRRGFQARIGGDVDLQRVCLSTERVGGGLGAVDFTAADNDRSSTSDELTCGSKTNAACGSSDEDGERHENDE